MRLYFRSIRLPLLLKRSIHMRNRKILKDYIRRCNRCVGWCVCVMFCVWCGVVVVVVVWCGVGRWLYILCLTDCVFVD
jgi:hypothetical protein